MRTAVGADEPRRHEPVSAYTTTTSAVTVTWRTPPTTGGTLTLAWATLDVKGRGGAAIE